MEGLRGFSAFLVFWVHYSGVFGHRVTLAPLRKFFAVQGLLGHCGVDIFFALSGFLVYGLLMKRPCRLGDFIWRRIQRLYPAFTVVFAVYVLLKLTLAGSALPGTPGEKLLYFLESYLMLPGIFPIEPLMIVAWSLSYELAFYLALPIVVYGLRLPRWPRWGRIVFVFLACAVQLTLVQLRIADHPRMVMFGCGILVYETIGFWKPGRLAGVAALAGFAGVLLIHGFRAELDAVAYSGPVLHGSVARIAMLFLATFALAYVSLREDGMVSALFRWRWMRWFGNMSYSFYLSHPLALHFTNRVLLPKAETIGVTHALVAMAVSFAGAVGIAGVLFVAVEKRFSFKRPVSRPAAMAAGA